MTSTTDERRAGSTRGRSKGRPPRRRLRLRVSAFIVVALALVSGACFETEEAAEFYGRVETPRAQEFRWSDGGMPRVFDPARAEAPPDTDVVRAMFEGLTDYDPQTLEPAAAVAARWESDADARVWTFHLRGDARWSNGDPVTARDFVRSWRRTLALGDDAPHANLLEIIEGVEDARPAPVAQTSEEVARAQAAESPTPAAASATPQASPSPSPARTPAPFGAEAVDDHTLRVRLRRPDRNFHARVSHPVFRPVHERAAHAETAQTPGARPSEGGAESSLITNGAFRLAELGPEGVVLERRAEYWDAPSVALERVRVVAKRDAEEALAAYRAGELDAVTNAAFEPLALKLLAPYKDFRRQTFGALTYYVFNTARPPFNDRRVREALALAIDHERLSQDTMGGATTPARRFNPLAAVGGKGGEVEPLRQDVARARRLLGEAGYPGGSNFPVIRLLVNRNEQQRILANAVRAMWQNNLGVKTEVVVRAWDEYEAMLGAGDYDVARRSVVMQTTGEESLMSAIFGRQQHETELHEPAVEGVSEASASPAPPAPETSAGGETEGLLPAPRETPARPVFTSEADALRELPAIPIYFPTSYSLVKPYVRGFDTNALDVPSLKRVRVDTEWRPPAKEQRLVLTATN
ncbi:MAG TPA: peptide ABC transporter substrate-binding protein [Pyrinomonadaceae bacterium]|nr:peptide ABC transporter substrate-binding protein [Pyrinomonadaceae bacterium]